MSQTDNTNTRPPSTDWSDVQGEIFQPYNYEFAAQVLLNLPAGCDGAGFINSLIDEITLADQWDAPGDSTLNIGFTYAGLAALNLPDDELESFPYPFRLGMAQRAQILGDTQESSPSKWEPQYTTDSLHGWIMIEANSKELRAERLGHLEALAEAAGVIIGHIEKTANFTGKHARAKEHFGFMDGIGQPAVEGAPGPSYPGQGTPVGKDEWKDIALGSFLLGYEAETGYTLPGPQTPELKHNSTYMVLRKLEQHVTEFRNYIESRSKLMGGDSELLAAKMVGRWRSGAPVELCPHKDNPELAADPERNNNFRYDEDVDGLNVPHLSHIRRANPRDGLSKDNVVQPRFHRVIRRKMPYGPYLEEGANPDDVPRGIMFRIYNADIVGQFEMVQAQWMSSANQSGGLSTDQDVMVGLTNPEAQDERRLQSTLPIPTKDGVKTLYGLPRFVTLKGGAYFFIPSITALRWIADTSAKQKEST